MNKLSLMQSFTSVVEKGSYTQAANHLGKSKAMVSKQVSQLEELLQVKLINRSTRSLAITNTGQTIYLLAAKIIEDVATLEVTAQGKKEEISGKIRITAPQTYAELSLMPIISSFLKKYPNMQVELDLKDRFVDIVEEGFDLAIRIGKLDDSNLIARQTAEVKLILVASPAFITVHDSIKHPDDLLKLPAIHDSNKRTGTKWSFIKEQKKTAIKPNISLFVNSAMAAKQAALASTGIALIPDFSVTQELTSGTLVHLLKDFETESIGVYLVYPHRQHLTAKVQAFITFLLATLENT